MQSASVDSENSRSCLFSKTSNFPTEEILIANLLARPSTSSGHHGHSSVERFEKEALRCRSNCN